MKNLQTLNGLRGLAALIVVISHASNHNLLFGYKIGGFGKFGVYLFFALSGFLMGHLYLNKNMTSNAWTAYIVRRLFRVYPLFFLIVLLGYVLYTHFGITASYRLNLQDVQAHWLLGMGKDVLWSVPVEIKFYVLFLIVGLCFNSMANNVTKSIFTVVMIALSIYITTYFEDAKVYELVGYLSIFIVGAFSSLIYPLMKTYSDNKYQFQLSIQMTVWICLLLIFLSIPTVAKNTIGFSLIPFNNIILMSVLMPLLVLSVSLTHGWPRSIFESRFFVFIGSISYSLYLTHHPILRGVNSALGRSPPQEIKLVIALTISIIIAFILFKLVESPFNILGHRIANRITPPPAL